MSSDAQARAAHLHDEHERLGALFEELENLAEIGAEPPDLQRAWATFDQAVRAHFAAEEEVLFPKIATRHPQDVAGLIAEHDRIRALLDTLGTEVDLHVIKEDTIKDLTEALRDHAVREDAGAYLWASTELDPRHLEEMRAAAARLLAGV